MKLSFYRPLLDAPITDVIKTNILLSYLEKVLLVCQEEAQVIDYAVRGTVHSLYNTIS